MIYDSAINNNFKYTTRPKWFSHNENTIQDCCLLPPLMQHMSKWPTPSTDSERPKLVNSVQYMYHSATCPLDIWQAICLVARNHDFLAPFLFFDSPFWFWSLFLFFDWIWNDWPTNEGCSFKAKLLATCPKWSFFTMKILLSSPRWAVYARTQEQNASLANFFLWGWDKT